MMTFRELVAYWSRIRKVSSDRVQDLLDQELNKIMIGVDDPSAHFDLNDLKIKRQNIVTAFNNFEQEITKLKTLAKTQIEQEEPIWFQRSYKWYDETLRTRDSQRPEFVDRHRNKRVPIRQETEDFYISRINLYNNWRHPGMIIHPGAEPFINNMVGCDPLYIIDESQYLLEPVLNSFNNTYQRRLRPYVIEESWDSEILTRIPNGQFGCCLAYNYFDFRPVEMIRKYLNEIYQKLKTGGNLLMTFNDCERPAGVKLAEQNYACYMTASLIKDLAVHVGYEIFFFWHNDSGSSWIELRKPGKLTSLRGGQTMAKIMPNPVANSK